MPIAVCVKIETSLERLKEYIRPFYLKWLYFRLRPDARPPQWTACWRYSHAPLRSFNPPAEAGTPPDILFLPMTDWHTRIQRAQHLARAMASLGHRVFFLNLNLGREYPSPVRLTGHPIAACLGERIWELHVGLPREPVYHHRLLDSDESESVAQAIELAAERFHIRQLVVISQFPLWNAVSQRLRQRLGAKLLYDCHDLLSGFSRIAPEIIAAEQALFQQADTVVFSAKSLMEKKLKELPWLGGKSAVVRNAADVSHFQSARQRAAEVPRGSILRGTMSKVAGYIGSLDEWFDVDAVRSAAQNHPDCKFVLLGRIEHDKVRELESLNNVELYGEIPYDRLPVYVAEFDIGLIPFQVNPLTMATNPIKLYEYFSCGLPVVSSRLPEVELFQDLVYLADTPEQFSAQVGCALAERDSSLRSHRRRAAELENWDTRARAILKAIAGAQ